MKTAPNVGKIFLTGSVNYLPEHDRERLFGRSTSADGAIKASVASIIDAVRTGGDATLLRLAREFDGVSLRSLEIPKSNRKDALRSIKPELRRALERSARNIASVQKQFLPTVAESQPEPGITVGRRPDPLDRVGIYAPGGRAAYPSSVLMGAVPARVAGVREVILCSPPGPDGLPSDVVLAAAELAGVDRVFAIGGAGAVAALAYGTRSVPRVDRIVGPGNAYVAEAKLQVSGAVAIDSPAGPSELLVIADGSADADVVAGEIMAQAEHDPRAVVVAVGIGEEVAARLLDAISRALPKQARREIISESLASRGAVLSAADIDEAVAFNNAFAPEHLMLAMEGAREVMSRFRNAGTIFIGERSSVAFGDYMTGANHVLPTGGLARSYSGLSVLDFIRWTTYQSVDPAIASTLAEDVGVFADAEGLPAHAASARRWKKGEQ